MKKLKIIALLFVIFSLHAMAFAQDDDEMVFPESDSETIIPPPIQGQDSGTPPVIIDDEGNGVSDVDDDV